MNAKLEGKSPSGPIHPFDRIFRLRYRLATLFFLTTLFCFLFLMATYDSGRDALLSLVIFVAFPATLYLLVAIFSWIVGTVGERQKTSETAHVGSTNDPGSPRSGVNPS
jgi:hypothetical protein